MAEAPDDPELYDLQQWLIKADAQGNTEDAKALYAEIERRQNPSWSELPKNIIPNAVEIMKSTGAVLAHPIDAAIGAAKQGYALASDPDERSALAHEIKKAVGTPQALKKTIIEHPVDTASMAIPGAIGAARGARAWGRMGGSILERAAQNPEQAAMLQAARGVTKVPEQIGLVDNTPLPTSAGLRNEARAHYDAVDNSNVRISPESFQRFADDLPSVLEGFESDIPELSPKANAVVGKLKNYLTEDDTLKFSKLDRLRQAINKAEATPDANDARLLGDIKDNIDEYIEALDDTHLDFGDAADLEAARTSIKEARAAWSKNAKIKRVEEIKDIAELQDNPDLYIRQRFTAITRKPRLFNQYNKDEKRLITKLAKHGTLGQLGRAAPHFTPAGMVKGAIYAGAGSTPLVGAPLAATVASVSTAAFHAAEKLRSLRMNKLIKEIGGERAATRAGLKRGSDEP